MENKLKKLVNNHTLYGDNQTNHYLPFHELIMLTNAILQEDKTAGNLTIIPLYCHALRNETFEFEDFIFSVDCEDELTQVKTIEFENWKRKAMEYYKEKEAIVHRHLCTTNDVKMFQQFLKDYIGDLLDRIPQMYTMMRSLWNLSEEELFLGQIVFDVTCE